MITNRDFIITGLQPWDTAIGSNAKDIAVELSRQNRVLYVDSPLDILTYRHGENTADFHYRAEAYRKKEPVIRNIKENLWAVDLPVLLLPANGIPLHKIFRYFNYINNRKIYRSLAPVIKKLEFKDYILFSDNDIYRSFYAKDMLRPVCSIYYRRDNLLDVDYWRKHGSILEPELVAKSDMVLANSQYLADGVKAYNKNCYNIGQGVDLSSFEPNEKQEELPILMKDIKKPVIGYVGALTSLRLDIDLLYKAASELSEFSFVFVGMEDDVFKNCSLHELPNTLFLGQQPMNEMPNYIASFDICINPQLVNPVTIGNYPRKVDEYLAMGKPVVAVKTPMMDLFKDYVSLASDAEEFIEAIRNNIRRLPVDDEEKDKKIAFAHTHSWSASVDKMYTYINQALK